MAPRRSCSVKGEGARLRSTHRENTGIFGLRISISRWMIDFLEGNEDFEKSIYPTSPVAPFGLSTESCCIVRVSKWRRSQGSSNSSHVNPPGGDTGRAHSVR
jgi:hypothetical protein